MAIIAARRPRHPTVRRWWRRTAYKIQVMPDQTSLGSQLQNFPQTDLAYIKPVISPKVIMVKPVTMHAYPVLSSSSKDGSRLKKKPRCLDLMAFSCKRYKSPAPQASANDASPIKIATTCITSHKLFKIVRGLARHVRQTGCNDHHKRN